MNNSHTLCPCGSGKYEAHCCAIKHTADEYEDLEAFLNARSHATTEELQASANTFMAAKNRAPLQEFCGFSAVQMGQLLYEPFASEDIIVFNNSLSPPMTSPVLLAMSELVQGIPAEGVKATAKGNLPMTICRSAAARFLEHSPERGRWRYEKCRTEEDLMPLNLVRLLLGLGGYLKKTKGRFSWTKRGQKFIVQPESHLYLELFKLSATRFNWGYFDGYASVPVIQQGFAYTLFLVQAYGDHFRTESFYAERFLEAFPMGLMEIDEEELDTAHSMFQSCYSVRSFDRFMMFFGLLESTLIDAGGVKERVIRKTSFLDGLVGFP